MQLLISTATFVVASFAVFSGALTHAEYCAVAVVALIAGCTA